MLNNLNLGRNVLVGLALAAAISTPAHAGTSTFDFTNATSKAQAVTFTDSHGSPTFSAYAGVYQGTLNGTPENIFCVDFTHEIAVGDTYQANTNYLITAAPGALNGSYYNGGLASALTASDEDPTNITASNNAIDRADEVAYLADNYLNSTASTFTNGYSYLDNVTAISLSIWDILQDGGNGIGTGSVQLNQSGQTDFGSLVSSYESAAASEKGYKSTTADWIQAPINGDCTHYQTYVYETGPNGNPLSAVPEPSSYLVIGLGMGVLLLAAAFRKRSIGSVNAA